jgi:hypothetical protein
MSDEIVSISEYLLGSKSTFSTSDRTLNLVMISYLPSLLVVPLLVVALLAVALPCSLIVVVWTVALWLLGSQAMNFCDDRVFECLYI